MHNSFSINGVETKYTRTNQSTNPRKTLVFLHGWSGNSNTWKENIESLSHKYDCIAIDFPGFGISAEPEQIWSIKEYAEFVRELANQLGIQNFVLVGKSFGGRIAIHYAYRWPETLFSLILVSAAGVEQKNVFTKLRILLAEIGKTALAPFGKKLRDRMQRAFYKATGVKKDANEYKWNVKKIVTNTDLTKETGNINIPTLIVWGTEDTILPLKWGKKLNKLIRNSKLVLIRGGHSAHIESAKDFNNIVDDFLTNQ